MAFWNRNRANDVVDNRPDQMNNDPYAEDDDILDDINIATNPYQASGNQQGFHQGNPPQMPGNQANPYQGHGLQQGYYQGSAPQMQGHQANPYQGHSHQQGYYQGNSPQVQGQQANGYQPQGNQAGMYPGNGYPTGSVQRGGNPQPGNELKGSLDKIAGRIDELAEKIDVISMNLGRLGSFAQDNSAAARTIQEGLNQLTELNSVVASQEATIRSQHDASLKFNDDVLYKVQKPLIMELISIADQIRMVIDNKREDNSYDLMEGLLDLEKSVEASLQNNSVRKFSETEMDDSLLNRKRQTVVGREDTAEESLNGHFRSLTPGYEWTMPYLVVNSEVRLKKILEENESPQTFSFVVRPEEVVKLTYRPEITESNNTDDTTAEVQTTDDKEQ